MPSVTLRRPFKLQLINNIPLTLLLKMLYFLKYHDFWSVCGLLWLAVSRICTCCIRLLKSKTSGIHRVIRSICIYPFSFILNLYIYLYLYRVLWLGRWIPKFNSIRFNFVDDATGFDFSIVHRYWMPITSVALKSWWKILQRLWWTRFGIH